MFKSIKTSEANRQIVTDLTYKLGLGTENVIARIALAYSISQGQKFTTLEILDSKGKEYSRNVLFGEYAPYYTALICQHYGIYKEHPDVAKYVKMHVDGGIKLISSDLGNKNAPDIEYLTSMIQE